jgi:hypothetical protein
MSRYVPYGARNSYRDSPPSYRTNTSYRGRRSGHAPYQNTRFQRHRDSETQDYYVNEQDGLWQNNSSYADGYTQPSYAAWPSIDSYDAGGWGEASGYYGYHQPTLGGYPQYPPSNYYTPPRPFFRLRNDNDGGYNMSATSDRPTPPERPPRSSPSPPAPPPAPRSPSPSYLAESEHESTSLAAPEDLRKLLILDLNGSLLIRAARVARSGHRHDRPTPTNGDQPNNNNNAAPEPPGPRLRAVHPRPYMNVFRAYLFAPDTRVWLDVMVWSSAQPHSVASMVDACFGEEKDKLVAVWARDTLGLSTADYRACPMSSSVSDRVLTPSQ